MVAKPTFPGTAEPSFAHAVSPLPLCPPYYLLPVAPQVVLPQDGGALHGGAELATAQEVVAHPRARGRSTRDAGVVLAGGKREEGLLQGRA